MSNIVFILYLFRRRRFVFRNNIPNISFASLICPITQPSSHKDFMMNLFTAQEPEANVNQVVGHFLVLGTRFESNLRRCTTHIEESIRRPIITRTRETIHEIVDGNPSKQPLLLSSDDSNA